MGKIILLNTPIGNLGDLTPRVLEALKSGMTFAVEDTRVFKELLNHLGISLHGKHIVSFHDQSKPEEIDRLIRLSQGGDLYLASDAGSPIISDPAYPIVSRARELGIKVESYSGVSSPIMALELSGLPPIPFHFQGFLPRDKGPKEKVFRNLSQGTHIFFEAPTRVEETLDLISSVDPNLKLAVVRELSKKFEDTLQFKSSDWVNFKDKMVYKGEFVLLVHKSESREVMNSELTEIAQEILAKGAIPKLIARLLGIILDRPTKDIYSLINRHKD